MARVYWASNMFTSAQRVWNERCAEQLRARGHKVFLPQDSSDNRPGHTPTSIDIFISDTAAIMDCDVVIGVLDDETIDSGVAAELGLAHALGKAVVGLYTDIRQNRQRGSMYKNLYVLGLLENSLGVWKTVGEVLQVLDRDTRLQRSNQPELLLPDLDSFVERLEASYRPPWSSYDASIQFLTDTDASVVIDFGCGTGRLAAELSARDIAIRYFGYDIDAERIELAQQRGLARGQYGFFAHLDDVLRAMRIDGVRDAVVLAAFVLHDMSDLAALAGLLLSPAVSRLFVLDLANTDLPGLTSIFAKALGRPPLPNLDLRMSVHRLSTIARDCAITVEAIEFLELEVIFPHPEDVVHYCDLYGLFLGEDLPFAPLIPEEQLRTQLRRVLDGIEFPMHDERTFVSVIGRAIDGE